MGRQKKERINNIFGRWKEGEMLKAAFANRVSWGMFRHAVLKSGSAASVQIKKLVSKKNINSIVVGFGFVI